MTEEDIVFFRALQQELWKAGNPDRFGTKILFETRTMTSEEWDMMVSVLNGSRELLPGTCVVCNPVNACMGFGFGMDIYLCMDETYPGTGVEKDGVLMVTQKHIPLDLIDNLARRATFEDGWRILSPFTHGEQNAALIQRYDFAKLREKSHYDY